MATPPSAAIRHSEKARTASCPFADRVATAVLCEYKRRCPPELQQAYKQTVLAGFVLEVLSATTNEGAEDNPLSKAQERHTDQVVESAPDAETPEKAVAATRQTLHVVSLAVGTKFLSREMMQSAQALQGLRLRDCHAEVLARRGLLWFLHHDAARCFSGKEASLFRLKSNCGAASGGTGGREKALLGVKAGVSLHMYTSSQPCGNACIKKWGKGQKPFDYTPLLTQLSRPGVGHSFEEDQLRSQERVEDQPSRVSISMCPRGAMVAARHAPVHVLHPEQVAVLVKGAADPSASVEESETTVAAVSVAPSSAGHPRVKKEKKMTLPLADWLPDGTALPGTRGAGTIATCSDKILRWNCVGVQGALLSGVLREPLMMSSITIGRKFSEAHSTRALCCRMDSRSGAKMGAKPKSNKSDTTQENPTAVAGVAVTTPTVVSPPPIGADGDSGVPPSSRGDQRCEKRPRPPPVSEFIDACPCHTSDRPRQTAAAAEPLRFEPHHPALLCTSVKFDDTVRGEQEQAAFDNPRCFVWAAGELSGHHGGAMRSESRSGGNAHGDRDEPDERATADLQEVIDGNTGERAVGPNSFDAPTWSDLSSAALAARAVASLPQPPDPNRGDASEIAGIADQAVRSTHFGRALKGEMQSDWYSSRLQQFMATTKWPRSPTPDHSPGAQ